MTKEGLEILLGTIHEEIKGNRESVKEVMNAGFSSVRAKIESEVDMVNMKVDSVIKRQDAQNGDMRRLDGCVSIVEKETVIVRWFQRNPGKTIIILVAFVFAVAFAFHRIDFKQTLKAKGIELKSE